MMNKLASVVFVSLALTAAAHADDSVVYGSAYSSEIAVIASPQPNKPATVGRSGMSIDDIKKLQDASESQKRELDDLRKSMSDLQSKNEDKGKSALGDINKQLDALKRDNDSLRSENKSLADSVRSLQSSVDSQKQDISSLSSRIK